MIEVTHLTKRYGSHVAVNDISFEVKDGEILGFLGPNGAGKSTTMNILTGYLSATEGSVSVNGYDVLEHPAEAKANIGFLPEQPPLYTDMTVREYLDFMYDLKRCTLPREQHIAEICRILKIEQMFPRLIRNLSKGYRQRVGFAQALIGNPPVLVLDEPTVGLDPNQIIEIRSLIKSLGKHHTVILSSHILSEIEATCDRIVVINKGQIVADATAAELSRRYSDDHRLLLRVKGPQEDVLALIAAVPGVSRVSPAAGQGADVCGIFVEPENGADVREEIFNRLAERHWPLMEMKTRELSLEEIFIDLTREQPAYIPQKKSVKRREAAEKGDETL